MLGGMARSVVLRPSPRCPGCQLGPRWCICGARETFSSPVCVSVLLNEGESYRPSSTGQLIRRLLPESRQHLHRADRPVGLDEVDEPGRELWVLHPNGEPPPAAARPETLHVLLLDASWRQAGAMARLTTGWGRRVRLPLSGESRYWLRTAAEAGRHSTMEALLGLLEHLGLRVLEQGLRVQFELHVYATLRARGKKAEAEEFLATSAARAELEARLRGLPAFAAERGGVRDPV